MAVFSGSVEVQEFSMKNDEEPKTKVYGKPLTERERRQVITQNRRGVTDLDEHKLYNLGLCANGEGIFIANIFRDGKSLKEVKSKDEAVDLLMGCRDVVFMNELKSWLIGMSELDEGEAKNFKLQSKPS